MPCSTSSMRSFPNVDWIHSKDCPPAESSDGRGTAWLAVGTKAFWFRMMVERFDHIAISAHAHNGATGATRSRDGIFLAGVRVGPNHRKPSTRIRFKRGD